MKVVLQNVLVFFTSFYVLGLIVFTTVNDTLVFVSSPILVRVCYTEKSLLLTP